MDKPTNADRIYEPESGEAQLSVRAVLTGCILGAVVAAMNISLGLKDWLVSRRFFDRRDPGIHLLDALQKAFGP